MDKLWELEELRRKYPSASPILILKISITVYGAVFTDRALSRIQQPDLRFAKGDPYGLSFDIKKENFYLPGPVIFRDGTSLFVNYGEPYDSPYTFDYDEDGGVFLVTDGGRVIDVIDFVPRPKFFDGVTKSGVPMDAVGGTGSTQRILFNAYQRCRFWEEGNQCRYCALFTSQSFIREVDPEDAYETLAEALKESGRFTDISVSGGSDFAGDPPFSVEIERYIRFLQALGRDMNDRFTLQLLAPAYPKEAIRRIAAETGMGSYRSNIEVWDEKRFKLLCPGKEKWIGRDEWIKRLLDAVDVLGKGRVYTSLVCGAELAKPYGFDSVEEAFDSNMACCEFMAQNGVYCQAAIWRPHRNEALGWQAMQKPEYYLKTAVGFHETRRGAFGDSDGCYTRGGDAPDSDLIRADKARNITVESAEELFETCAERYIPTALPETLTELLKNPDSDVFVEIGEAEGKNIGGRQHFRAQGLFSPDGRRLLLPLESDKDELSSYLTKKLWFKSPAVLIISSGGAALRLTMRVYRHHVVGGLFSAVLERVRGKAPDADMAAVCELHLLKYEPVELGTYGLCPRQNSDGGAMPHLDRQMRL